MSIATLLLPPINRTIRVQIEKFYCKLRREWLKTGKVKMDFLMIQRSRELGIGPNKAWEIVREAKKAGRIKA